MPIDLNQIAAQIRLEGFREGYEAARKDMASFLEQRQGIGAAQAAFGGTVVESAQSPSGRAPRGQAKQLVIDALKNMTVIGTAKNVQSYLGSRGHNIPYSSIQNAMMQLTKEDAVILVDRGTWALKPEAASDAEAREAALNALAFD